MKALIRNQGETITERDGIVGIDWGTGAPLTNLSWAGGPYTMVNEYVSEDPGDDFPEDTVQPSPASQDPVVEEAAPDTIVIDGVTYTRTP